MSATFTDRLAAAVTLTIAGARHAIPGGAVERIELELEPHGFTGMLEFVLQDDADRGGGFTDRLRSAFLSRAPLAVRVELAAVYDQAEAVKRPEPLVLSGLATRRSTLELQLRRSADQPILARRYRVWLADPAQVLWSQHFPCRLYTRASLADLIREQLGDEIRVRFDWPEADVARPMLFLHLPVEHGTSFYDFVFWYADRRGAQFTHDYAAADYQLRGGPDAAAEPLALFGDDIRCVELVVPPTPAHGVEVCNTYAESARTAAITHEYAAAAIRHDHLMRSSIGQEVDERVDLEKSRLKLPMLEAELTFGRMPVVRLVPGGTVRLSAGDRWSEASALVGTTWRVRRLSLRAVVPARPLDAALQLDSAAYEIALSARLVDSGDARPCHPAFRHPRYPGFAEGKIVSAKGEAGDKTYQVYRNETSSLDEYTVALPAWGGQTVSAPFIPYLGSGNVYVPSYRDERVLLALDLDHARIERLLVWRDGAALSMDVQGEHILLGKSQTSNTSINHVYEDDRPVFNVARTSKADTELIRLSEGALLLRVQEKEG
ncbi:hypothetical protein [Nannocystis sp. SCPEA4]|uniref:hypothetical protein n=1 Tax=Nannocystis sp. SCPEA4 TaxID=2996787 RepID=UPI002270F941|nr:hypothetical protein [Nannocystis sp. SCPEA4]MCY1059594.1 hypothetical protein [Nannocystis sp. SCPEA4]